MQQVSIRMLGEDILIGDYEFANTVDIDLAVHIDESITAISASRVTAEAVFHDFFERTANVNDLGVLIGMKKVNSTFLTFTNETIKLDITIIDNQYGYESAKSAGISFQHMKMIEKYIKKTKDKITRAFFLDEEKIARIIFTSEHNISIKYL